MTDQDRPPAALGRAKLLLRAGYPRAAEKALDDVELASPETIRSTSLFVRVHRGVARALAETDPLRALDLLGRAARLDPDAPEIRFDAQRILLRTRLPAPLSCFAPELHVDELAPRAFIAAMPRSASTYLSNLVVGSTGWPRAALRFSLDGHDQDVDLPTIRRFATRSTVTQQHCRATESNLHLLQAFGVRPIVLVRDVPDALLSNAEFRDRGGFAGAERDPWPEIDPAFRLDVTVDELGPWYLSFYAGWTRADRESRLPLLRVSWDEVSSDPTKTLERIHTFLELPSDHNELAAVVRRVDTQPERNRLVSAVSGRGGRALTPQQLERLAAMARAYPDIDFAPVGVPG